MATGARRARWRVDENDFGGPMVEHLHPDGPAIAYVLANGNGREVARCTACGGQKALAAAPRDQRSHPGSA